MDADSSLIFSPLYFIMFMFKDIYFLPSLILVISLKLYLISCICIITQVKLLYIFHWNINFCLDLLFFFLNMCFNYLIVTEYTLCDFSLWNLLKLALWPSIWSIFILCVLKRRHFLQLLDSSLYIICQWYQICQPCLNFLYTEFFIYCIIFWEILYYNLSWL